MLTPGKPFSLAIPERYNFRWRHGYKRSDMRTDVLVKDETDPCETCFY